MSAEQSASRQLADEILDGLLLRIGRLNYVWTNTESLLIHVIAGLGGGSKEVAVVIFLTLNSTKARLELVERLAKLPSTPADQRKDVLALTRRFQDEAPLRNKYNHCIYSFDMAQGKIATILMRIADRRDELRIGRSDPADEIELATIDSAIRRIQALNLDLWATIGRHRFPT